MSPDPRVAEVRQALAAVADPELDQSVVDLGFIERIAVDGNSVAVDYRLPTAWCSLNFAWIMSEDMREAVAALDWVDGVTVRLVDHFAAGKINAGIARAHAFGETFGANTDASLAALRETFRRKAFLGRMSALIDALRSEGNADPAILALTVGDLRGLAVNPALSAAIARYLDLRSVYGGDSGSNEPAFRTADGDAIEPAKLSAFLRDIRMTRRGVEANGEMCRMLLQARQLSPPEPTPQHGPVPPSQSGGGGPPKAVEEATPGTARTPSA